MKIPFPIPDSNVTLFDLVHLCLNDEELSSLALSTEFSTWAGIPSRYQSSVDVHRQTMEFDLER
jgi:hypothetical protein